MVGELLDCGSQAGDLVTEVGDNLVVRYPRYVVSSVRATKD
jgi:hypothetical protein